MLPAGAKYDKIILSVKKGDSMREGTKRIYFLDELRGFAIICMVIHHMFYDFGFVLGFPWGYEVFDFLCRFQPVFWAIFIVTSGICSRLSRNTIKRGALVLGAGLAVTFVTAVIMPAIGMEGAEIYFGILSCLGCCMIITGLLMPAVEKTNAVFGMLASLLLFFAFYGISSKKIFFGLVTLPDNLYKTNWLCPLGFFSSSFESADYFSIIPWLFMFLFGAFLGKYAKAGAFPKAFYKSRIKLLQLAGKNSLWIYLLHQPLLYGLMYIIAIVISLIR